LRSPSTAPFTNSFRMSSISSQLLSAVLVTVTKLLAKKTPSTKLNLNNSLAKGDSIAFSRLGKSRLPLRSSLLTRNLRVAGLGVSSVYTLIVAILSCIIQLQNYEKIHRESQTEVLNDNTGHGRRKVRSQR